MNKSIIISLLISALIVGGAVMVVRRGGDTAPVDGANVVMENGVQVIHIDARGGYSPRKSVAKSGIPTVVRFNTSGTYDCSASVTIPELRVNKLLSSHGSTDIEVGERQAGTLSGSCSMGMYPFSIEFQ